MRAIGGWALALLLVGTACGIIAQGTGDTAAATAEIAFIAADNHLVVSQPDGSGQRQLSRTVSGLSFDPDWMFRWPTFSPDGRRLAFAGYLSGPGDELRGAILSADLARDSARTLLESSDAAPIYIYWAPDSRHLAGLVQRGRDQELLLFDTDGQQGPVRLLVGQPLYWSWAPDSRSLAVHVGGDGVSNAEAWIGRLTLGGSAPQEERFSETPGRFHAPAWSPDGRRLAYATLGGGTSILTVRDATGAAPPARLASAVSDLAFTWSPDSEWLAFSGAIAGRQALYEGIEVIRPDGNDRRRVADEPVIAYFWSPDSKRLAYVRVDEANRTLAWSVVGSDGRTRKSLGDFIPSEDFGFQLPFFNQYAQSTSVWSPDSRRLVYGAEADRNRSSFGPRSERIMLLEVDRDTPASTVVSGGTAVWSPVTAR